MSLGHEHISEEEMHRVCRTRGELPYSMQDHLEACGRCSRLYADVLSLHLDFTEAETHSLDSAVAAALNRKEKKRSRLRLIAAAVPVMILLSSGFVWFLSNNTTVSRPFLSHSIGECQWTSLDDDRASVASGPYSICEIGVADHYTIRLFGESAVELSSSGEEPHRVQKGMVAVARHKEVPLSVSLGQSIIEFSGTKVLIDANRGRLEVIEGSISVDAPGRPSETVTAGSYIEPGQGIGPISRDRLSELKVYFDRLPESVEIADYEGLVRRYFSDRTAGLQTVYLKDGRTYRGAVSNEGADIIVTNQNGVFRFSTDQIDRISFR